MKVNRIISIALSVILMVALLCSSVSANELPMPRATTDIFYTPQMTAGIEWSGYANNRIHDLACSKDNLTGEDINIYFYKTGVGLSDEYERDLTRSGEVTVKENDPGANDNETLFTRTGTFAMDNGKYRMCLWSTRSDINTDVVETNSTLELYILIYIQTKPEDQSTVVPENFMAYKFVTTY